MSAKGDTTHETHNVTCYRSHAVMQRDPGVRRQNGTSGILGVRPCGVRVALRLSKCKLTDTV